MGRRVELRSQTMRSNGTGEPVKVDLGLMVGEKPWAGDLLRWRLWRVQQHHREQCARAGPAAPSTGTQTLPSMGVCPCRNPC